MSLLEAIDVFRDGLAWGGLVVLFAIAVACVGVWLFRSARGVAAKMRRFRTWIDGLACAFLSVACVLIAGTKTNSPPAGVMPPILPPLPQTVGQPTALQVFSSCGAVTNSDWLAHGAYEDWFYIPATNWWARASDGGWIEALRVFSFGGFQAYGAGGTWSGYPPPFSQKLSMAPMANWNMLANATGGTPVVPVNGQDARYPSLFWHGVTGSNTLVMTWQNGLYARCATNLVSFQAELFNDGSVAYRYDGSPVATNDFVVPLELPFDRDGDGLENSVDPESDVAGPDAHGTNAEWYNTVCSNVFEAVEGGGTGTTGVSPVGYDVDFSWREGVNSNAYYFVDVVAERGPAPIRFTGDRASRLGDPVVVARAGETNRVPLLIGVDYAVTSDTPFSVSFPVDYMYPEVETNAPCVARIHWPLEFTVTPGSDNDYTVSAGPYDPGCEFRWGADGSGGGLRTMSPARALSCGYSTSGGWIGFSCGGNGDCGCHGCSVGGSATFEGASFDLPSVWCGCWYYDSESPEYPELPQTNSPAVSVCFSKRIVFYEDAYTNAPGDVVGKRSTDTTLTISAWGGDTGGMLYVSDTNIGKLNRKGGSTITFPYTAYIPPNGGASFAIEYEAVTNSVSENDITVAASIAAAEDSASVTAVKVQLEAQTPSPVGNNISRHKYGVREIVLCKHFPENMMLSWTNSGNGSVLPRQGGDFSRFLCPLTDSPCQLIATSEGGESYSLTVSIVEPTVYYCQNIMQLDSALAENVAGDAGMTLELYIEPRTVCFGNIAMEEVPTETGGVAGYFLNTKFSNMWAHTRDNRAGQWCNIGNDNLFMFADEARLGGELPPMAPDGTLTNDVSFGWQGGAIIWTIPLGWNEHGTSDDTEPIKTTPEPEQQLFTITPSGTLSVIKAGHYVSRGTNTQIRSGRVQR